MTSWALGPLVLGRLPKKQMSNSSMTAPNKWRHAKDSWNFCFFILAGKEMPFMRLYIRTYIYNMRYDLPVIDSHMNCLLLYSYRVYRCVVSQVEIAPDPVCPPCARRVPCDTGTSNTDPPRRTGTLHTRSEHNGAR